MKELASGLMVDAQQYYKLLLWKDQNMEKFSWACKEFNIPHPSINTFTEEQYKFILSVANLD